MNVQNAKNLTITEGSVKTIHDKDNRLLWGAVGYDTKYGGDTTQNGEPTPDAPVDINVVTGEQTVVVSDGTNSQTFTIDLGSIELCKIGTYQDYIYKSGDDWYVHKAVDTFTVPGSGTRWGISASTGSPNYYYVYTSRFDSTDNADYAVGISNRFIRNSSTIQSNSVVLSDVYSLLYRTSSTSNHLRFMILQSRLSAATSEAVNTFFANNETIIYYALATPTDTKITDSTLIGQLNTVHQWLVRYGYYGTVSTGSPNILPLEILQTLLT